jgi:uncharacterized protein (DUF305 family)
MHANVALKLAFISAGLLVTACGRSDTATTDTSALKTGTVAQMDTGMGSMSGMDHSKMAMTPARDADQEFLRMMVDHHQGLIVLSDTTLAKNPSQAVASEARELRQKQAAEQKDMSDMLKADYSEDKMPMVMPSNERMIAQVASTDRSNVDSVFREKVIAHHEEALKMIADFEARFAKPAVRTMAMKMKSDQQKEIAKLKAQLGRA